MGNNEKKINWHIGIPVVLLEIIKTSLEVRKNNIAGNDVFEVKKFIIMLICTFNSNTFSTFISIIAYKLYQYFSTDNIQKREGVSGLATRYIPSVFVFTVIYGMSSAFDAAISHFAMAIIFYNKCCICGVFF